MKTLLDHLVHPLTMWGCSLQPASSGFHLVSLLIILCCYLCPYSLRILLEKNRSWKDGRLGEGGRNRTNKLKDFETVV